MTKHDEDRCEHCGACKHCGAPKQPQIQYVPYPYPVYPTYYPRPVQTWPTFPQPQWQYSVAANATAGNPASSVTNGQAR